MAGFVEPPAFLELHPPRRKPHTPGGGQYRPARRLDRSPVKGKCTGATILHTSEGAMDTVGIDTGTETLARFVQRRTDAPGSYHDVADSDSWLHLVDWDAEAYHDGTGSNPWSTSISFVCRTVDWARMSPARRRGFLTQGALAFVAQQVWRQARGYPLTRLRLIASWQVTAGESGLCYHGSRDPKRRTDPGTTSAAPFPIVEFIDVCRQLLPDWHPDSVAEQPAAPAPKPVPSEEDAMVRIVSTDRDNTLWLVDVGAGTRRRLVDLKEERWYRNMGVQTLEGRQPWQYVERLVNITPGAAAAPVATPEGTA